MASGLPFLKFFPDDYLSDERLSFCSLTAQGLWMRMLCFMHKNVRRGYLDGGNGEPLSLDQIARFAGVPREVADTLVQELLTSGVASATAQGTIYNRRMVRDEALRQVRALAGQKGGQARAHFAQAKVKQKSSKPLVSGIDEVVFASELENPSLDGENALNMRSHFLQPSLEEVRIYCNTRANNVDPQQFIDHYTSNGWKVGRNCMKDWKAAVRNWEKNSFAQAKSPEPYSTAREWASQHDLSERHPGERQ